MPPSTGFGIHGIIFRTEGNAEVGDIATAIKVHRSEEPYLGNWLSIGALRKSE
jgi:hypothetical protein